MLGLKRLEMCGVVQQNWSGVSKFWVGGGESARVVLRQRESGSARELAKGQVDESA